MIEGTTVSESKLWTKNFILLSLANFFVAMVFYVTMTTMAVYAVQKFQASESEAGLASSIFVIGAVFSRLYAGKYMEVVGRKKMLYGSLFFFLIAALLYFPANSLPALLLVRTIHGAALGVATTVMPSAAMDLIPSSRRGEGTSYYSLSPTVATALGPFIGILILQFADHRIIFVACAVFAAISIVIALFVRIPEANLTQEQRQAIKQGFRIQDFFEKNAFPISSLMFLMGIAYSGVISFINSYAIEIRLVEAAGYFFIVYAVFLFIARPISGKLLDRRGDNFVIYPAILMFAVSLLQLSQVSGGFSLLAASAVLAFGFGTLMSSVQAIAVKVTPRHRVGLATSTFFICLDGGIGLGPFLVGMLIQWFGYRGMYVTFSIIVFASVGLYHFLHGKKAAQL